MYFKPTCNSRAGKFVFVICPNVELPNVVFGSEKWCAFMALNASKRICNLSFSRMRSALKIERSKLTKPGPKTVPVLDVPNTYAGGLAKQLVSNHLLISPIVFT